jgi:hypothetical protein
VALIRTELVTTLKRKATEIIAELQSEEVLVGSLEGIALGEKAVEEGRTVSHGEAKQRMARWLE